MNSPTTWAESIGKLVLPFAIDPLWVKRGGVKGTVTFPIGVTELLWRSAEMNKRTVRVKYPHGFSDFTDLTAQEGNTPPCWEHKGRGYAAYHRTSFLQIGVARAQEDKFGIDSDNWSCLLEEELVRRLFKGHGREEGRCSHRSGFGTQLLGAL